MKSFKIMLQGGMLRSKGSSEEVVSLVNTQEAFDSLFAILFDKQRIVAMRAADAIEKITRANPLFIAKHKHAILCLANKVVNKEVKWHIAQLIPRLCLNNAETAYAWGVMMQWAKDKTNSNIVRVNAVQALFNLLSRYPAEKEQLDSLVSEIKRENIPSINARLRRLQQPA